MIIFVHDSDLHYGKYKLEPRRNKEKHPESIISSRAQFVIVTGDLTENGYDGKRFGCFRYGGDEDQLSPFLKNYVAPIEESGREVYLCAGNHDRGKRFLGISIYPAVKRLIQKRHGGSKYTFRKGDLKFICCHECPSDIKWLKKQLNDQDQPTIIFFHFNLQGPFSDWWSQKQKDVFYAAIKDYNIVGILVGHHHLNQVSEWKGIKVINSANQFSYILYDPLQEKIVNVICRH